MKKLLFILLLISTSSYSQKIDTVHITSRNLNLKALIPGEHHWLVYFKNGKDSSRISYEMWNRKVEFINYHGQDAISITQKWEGDKAVNHTAYTVVNRKTFEPLYHKVWWTVYAGEFDYETKTFSMNGKPVDLPTANERMTKVHRTFMAAMDSPHFIWHLDLETFPLLPYKNNTAFVINFYDPGFTSPPSRQVYTVIGSDFITATDGAKVECWKLAHGEASTDYEVFWISKKTREVLRLQQEYKGKFRYKIKLAEVD